MTSIHPTQMYGGQPPVTTYTDYGNQPPGYNPQQPPPGGYYVAAPGSMPPQGYVAAPGAMPPQGYAAAPAYAGAPGAMPPQAYAAPPGAMPLQGEAAQQYPAYYPPPGSMPPTGYAQPQQYAPAPGAAWVDPATGKAAPYNPAMGAAYPTPMAQPVYAIPVASNPAPSQNPANVIETGRWSAGLCDCCNNCFPNMFMSWCCPCVALAQIYARLALARYYVVLSRLFILVVGGIVLQFVMPRRTTSSYSYSYDTNGNLVYEPAPPSSGSMALTIVLVVIQFAFAGHVFHARTRIRGRFAIPGNCCGDCLVSWCCSCCAIAQMATHVKSYKASDCSFGAPDVLPAY